MNFFDMKDDDIARMAGKDLPVTVVIAILREKWAREKISMMKNEEELDIALDFIERKGLMDEYLRFIGVKSHGRD